MSVHVGTYMQYVYLSIVKTHDALVLWEGLRLGFPLFLGFGMGVKRVRIVE